MPKIKLDFIFKEYGMKITGTKKLLIIFFALLCCLAVSLGVMISRSGAPSRVSATAYAESIADETTDGAEDEISNEDEELVEKEYDERFDESAIRSVAELFELDYEVVNLYCHIYDVDAREILNIYYRDLHYWETKRQNETVIDYDKERDGELTEEEAQELQNQQYTSADSQYYESYKIMEDIANFKDLYANGEIVVSEEDKDEDWFVSPDEVASYAAYWHYVGYLDNNYGAYFNVYTQNINSSTAAATPWIDITSTLLNQNNLHIPSTNSLTTTITGSAALNQFGRYTRLTPNTSDNYVDKNEYNGTILTSGAHNFNCAAYFQAGLHLVVELEAGQKLRFTGASRNNGESASNFWWIIYYGSPNAGVHYEKQVWYANSTASLGRGGSEIIVDGDAPTGSIFYLSKGVTHLPGSTDHTRKRTTWAFATGHAQAGTGGSPSNATYNNKCAQYWMYWIEVKRKDPPKPELVEHDSGDPNTRTAVFDGEPVTLAANPDYGASMMMWSASPNQNFTQVDSTVTLKSRSQHGIESVVGNGFHAADIVVQSGAKGTHYVRFTSTTGKWSDGSTNPVTFKLVVTEQFTTKPTLFREAGVNAKGDTKEVNYTGGDHFITIQNADPKFLSYTAPGMEFESWDEGTKTLILKQREQGTYTITMFLSNPAGCSWADDHSTGSVQFTFKIKEMLISKPKMTEWSTGQGLSTTSNSLTVDYDGDAKYIILSPAREEQLIVIAAGMTTEFIKEDKDNDGTIDYYACKLSVTNSGTQTITVMPNEGYLWSDGGGTSTPLSFKVTINAQKVSFPYLKADQDGLISSTAVELMFNPDPNWMAYLVIENAPKDALIVTHAMDYERWVPVDYNGSDPFLDREATVLTLGATRAIKYVVTFDLVNSNYRWADATQSVPQFSLEILKYELYAPYIPNQLTASGDTTVGTISINGYTKTIYWNSTDTTDNWTNAANRNFDLFVGGFTQYKAGLDVGQIEIRYSKDGLTEDWSGANTGKLDGTEAFLSLWAGKAGNYLIDITPTDNYVWKIDPNDPVYSKDLDFYKSLVGKNNMVTFKFEVVPIFRDVPELFSKIGSTSWTPEGLNGETVYDGTEKTIRIGNENDPTKFYLDDQMDWALVDNDTHAVIAMSGETAKYPDGFWLVKTTAKDVLGQPILHNGETIPVLEGYVTNARTYTIRLQLGSWSGTGAGRTWTVSENYAWRDGSGADIFYTFTVVAQALGTPTILVSECGGGENRQVYPSLNLMTAGFDGHEIQLAINVKAFKVGNESIISVVDAGLITEENPNPLLPYEPDYNRTDGHLFWQSEWAVNKEGTERLIVKAINRGVYTVRLVINNTNYRWDNDSPYYEFNLYIDYANVMDIMFYYGDGDDKVQIGGNNSEYTATFDPDKVHQITVTRNPREDSFHETDYKEQFTYEVSYSKGAYPMIGDNLAEGVFTDRLVLDFKYANTYFIDIFLTDNYRWESMNGLVGFSLRLTFTISPKYVNVPTIIDEQESEGSPTIDQNERIKTIIYDAKTSRGISINLGKDIGAFVADKNQTTSFLTPGSTITTLGDKYIFTTESARFSAKSAGTYVITVTLSDSNNYYWAAGETVTFTLKIIPRPIAVPSAYFVVQDEISDPHNDYLNIQSGTIGKSLTPDVDGVYRVSNEYNGKFQYIYLFGYAVENNEVEITITPSDPDNYAGNMGKNNISVSGVMRGTYIYTKLVNKYTIKIEFKLSDEFGTPNCRWDGLDILPRVLELTIDKKGLALPEINKDPTQAWAPDSNGNDSLNYHFTYDGAATGPSLVIDHCLSSAPIMYMTYEYNRSRTKYFLDETTNKLEFSITSVATVGVEYVLKISLDDKNEYWLNPNAVDDSADKYIYIIIDKREVVAPNLLNEFETNATYNGNTKMFTYNGSAWPSALKVANVDYGYVEYKTSVSSMTAPWIDSANGNVLVTGSTIADSGTYSLVLSLKDNINLKWGGPTWTGPANDSSNLVFSLIIDPERIAKPVLDSTNTQYNTGDTWSLTDNDTTLNVIYQKDANNISVMQYIVILNFVNNTEKMSFESISGRAFEEILPPTNILKVGSEDVGLYQIKITPSKNVGWDDGTDTPIIFSLNIEKKVYATPVIDDLGDPNLVSGQTMTVTYILDTYQQFTIKGIDNKVLEFVESTSSLPDDARDRELVNKGTSGTDDNEYNFEAKNVGTYTVTFNLLNPDNERLALADADHIVFTLIIEKLSIDVPVIDTDASVLLTDESAVASTFTAVYDAQTHGTLVLNVLDEHYLTYKPVNSIYDKNTGTSKDLFYYGDPVAATSATDTVGTVFNIGGVNTKFDGSFANGTTTVSDPITKTNFILLRASEPGTYEMVFSLADSANVQWAGGTVTDKTVKFVLKKKQIAAPDYNSSINSKPYTGKPVTFELKNIYGVEVEANNYVDSLGNPAGRGFEYEIFEVSGTPDIAATIKAVELNVDTHVLKLEATQIGTYKVRITIKDTQYTEWTTAAVKTKEFTFTITKSSSAPSIDIVDPKLDDGTPDTITQAAFTAGNYVWPKSTTVSVTVTVPKLSVSGGKIVIDNSLGFDVYYVNNYDPLTKLSLKSITPSVDASDLFTGNAPTTAGVYPSTKSNWSLVVAEPNPGEFEYSLVYTFPLTHDTIVHQSYGFIPQGRYTIHFEQSGVSNTYTVASANKGFEVQADRAPFLTNNIADHIVWQMYYVSDPDTVVQEYKLSDIFPTATNPDWLNMTAAEAVSLNFLEDNESYGFRFSLDSVGMNGETDVRAALQSWQVDWVGNYGGNVTAKYAGNYSVYVTIKALDPNAFSYPDTRYTFYYKIDKEKYDLDGLVWDYTSPFTYDGNTHTVSLTGTLPMGLSIASYDVTGYDRNSQIAAKAKYTTSVIFASVNPNYIVPDVNDPTTYKSTVFQWTVDWTINKANISANWDYKVEAGETATMSIPRLDAHGEKVEYTYYKDNGDPDPDNWDVVTSFVNDVATKYRVVATLKSDPSNPELDYANNYILTVNGGDSDNSLTFTMPAGSFISIYVEIDGKEQYGDEPDTSITGNIHKYTAIGTTGKVYSATVTLVGAVGLLNDSNLAITYYNTNNTLKPIPAPSEPGHYLIKVKLVGIDTSVDTNQYVLPVSEYYFDIEKGDFAKGSVYWRYTHTDSNGTVTIAKWDETWKYWQIESVTDAAGVEDLSQKGLIIPSFVYDGSVHTVELWSDDTNLVITTKNRAQLNAGQFTTATGKLATASFSYNGKLWNSPTDASNPVITSTTFEWEIEKAVIELAGMQWDYTADYVYTVSGGIEKKFTVKMDDSTIPTLLKTFVEYKTYDLDKLDEEGQPEELESAILSRAGHYKTVFLYDAFEEDTTLTMNYEIGAWPSGLDKELEWEIAVRVIDVPTSNGSWTVFDGKEYDLLSSINLPADWQEYINVDIEYAKAGTTDFADYSQMGIDEFGSETFASHAGKYKFIFSIVEGLNSTDQTNVEFRYYDPAIPDFVQSTNEQESIIEIAKATMTVENWVGDDEWSTVTLSGAYVSNDFVDYYFEDASGQRVPITEVVITSGVTFTMYVYVREANANDIDLVAAPGEELFHTITTLVISNDPADQEAVRKVPYIIGYKTNDGFRHEFTYAEWQAMMLADADFFKNDKHFNEVYGGVFPTDEKELKVFWYYYLGSNPDDPYDPSAPEEGEDEDEPEGASEGVAAEDPQAVAMRVAVFKSKVRVSYTYSGDDITFIISDWDFYSQYLDIWQGNLNQTDAGDYSVTLLFKKSTVLPPFSWGVYDEDTKTIVVELVDGNITRDPVVLNFRIAFSMIPIPQINEGMFPTYTGSELDILSFAWKTEEAYDEWLNEYGKYFEVTGATGTSAGGYTLQLKIKDIYLNTVHWDNNTAKGQPGTYTIKWEILPIYIMIPSTALGVEIVYDGSAHSVFELLEGYNDGNLSDELKALLQLAQISGDSGVNAGTYEARFKLPDTNYAWKSPTGGISDDLLQTLPWAIQKKKLDMSHISWNYDPDTFQYTLENGEVQEHEIILEGVPEDLKEFISYFTDGERGNSRSLMGTYMTVVYFFQDNVEFDNYSFENAPREFLTQYADPAGIGYCAIKWSIGARKFKAPVDKEIKFDGTIRELVETFGLPEGWENYLDVTVEYKVLDANDNAYASYADFVAEDAFLGYSPFKAFYLGNYRVTFNIKRGLNDEAKCVVWVVDGQDIIYEQQAVLTITPLEIVIEGWNDPNDGSYNITIISEAYEKLENKDIFEYIIRDYASGEILDMDINKAIQIIKERGAGLYYSIEFAIKAGNDYAISKGIEIGCLNDSVTNPYIFGNFDYPQLEDGPAQSSVVLWLPKPILAYTGLDVVNGKITYDGNDKIFEIVNWSDYAVDEDFASMMFSTYGVDVNELVEKDKSGNNYIVPVGETASWVNLENGKITVKKAGDFDITLRFLPNINISWYDSDDYIFTYDDGFTNAKLCVLNTDGTAGAQVTGTALDALIDRYPKTLPISIEKAVLDPITPEIIELLESMIPDLDYTGKEYNLMENVDEAKALFNYLKTRYKNVFVFEGYTGVSAGDYELVIKLKDPTSSYWDLKQSTTVVVNDKSYSEYDAEYTVMWVKNSEGVWSVEYVKPDSKGDYTDANGTKYSRYNGGNYNKIDPVYKTKVVVEYVQIRAVEYVQASLVLDEDGKPKDDGKQYIVDPATGKAIKYSLVNNKYVVDPDGAFVSRYKVTPDQYLDEDGKPLDDGNLYVVDDNECAVRYSVVNNQFVEDPNGDYIAKYKLRADGTVMETPEMVDGRNVIDTAKTKVTVTQSKTSVGEYRVKWRIVGKTLLAPTVSDTKKLVYNGSEQFADAVLVGSYSPNIMTIVSGASGTDAGTYVAKIMISDPVNYSWREGVEVIEEDGIQYVEVEWTIEKAKVDLSNARWIFTDGVKEYKDGKGMVYTRKGGEPVVYWAALDNIPEAVKSSIRYSTNGKIGACAGTDAGLYNTSFEILDPNGNFEEIILPDSIPVSVSWSIERRVLTIPTVSDTQMFFDDAPHDLRDLLTLQEDWEEYFTITIMYAKNFILFSQYDGYNGEPFTAYGAGAYRFIFNIIPGLNKNASNPSVVWLKSAVVTPEPPESDEDVVDPGEEEKVPETPEVPEVEEIAQVLSLSEEPVTAIVEELAPVAEELVETADTVEIEETVAPAATEKEDITVTTVQDVCDRIKELTYGAQIKMYSFRKYLK